MRSVYLHKDKSIFKVDELPAEEFAASLGLPGAPKIKFLAKDAAKKKKNVSHIESAALNAAGIGDEDEDGTESEKSADESVNVESETDKPKEMKKVCIVVS